MTGGLARRAADTRPSLRWGTVLVVAGAVFLASVVDLGPAGAPTFGPLGLVGADKWFHAAGYAAFALAVAFALVAGGPSGVLLALVVPVAFGAGIEVLQAFLPPRTASTTDALANAVGALLGVTGWWVAGSRKPKGASSRTDRR